MKKDETEKCKTEKVKADGAWGKGDRGERLKARGIGRRKSGEKSRGRVENKSGESGKYEKNWEEERHIMT
jgi:hypothetical protein